MCIRDRYQRRVHGDLFLNLEHRGKKISAILSSPLIRKFRTSLEFAKEAHEKNKRNKLKLEIYVVSDTLLQTIIKHIFELFSPDGCPFSSVLLLELYFSQSEGYYIQAIYNNQLNAVFGFSEFFAKLTVLNCNNYCENSLQLIDSPTFFSFLFVGVFLITLVLGIGFIFYRKRGTDLFPHIEFSKIPSNNLQTVIFDQTKNCLLYTSPSPRDLSTSRMPSSA
eukprot:TRINITY_DN60634_c0_g1_i1.p1 TRINITY_DN60634_c0_g1~~TRINITY_DN60634_c0_g1_i1.p1  ORF type:complete len:222 (+),score=30.22 TRINITY_DN60634_c0_g1_i1:161-826(+)